MPGFALDLVPGLWVLALTAAGAVALGRWFDRVPWGAVGVYAALVAALYGPALYGGRVLLAVDNLRGAAPFTRLEPSRPAGNHLQGDQVLELAPLQAEVRRTLRRGEWPLWSERIGAGAPLLGNPSAQALQPLAAVGLPLPLPRAAGAVAALRVTVALLGMHLLLARLGAGRWAAAAGAIAYGLGGHLQLWLGWPRANAAAWLPVLLWAVVLVEARGRRRDPALLTGVSAAVLLGGDGAAAGYALAAALALALVRAARRPPAERAAPLLAQGAAVALAFGLAAPALLPAADFTPRTPQTFALAGRADSAQRADPLGLVTLTEPAQLVGALRSVRARVLPAVAPNAHGNSRYGRYWGPANSNEDASIFAGTLTALLAGVASVGWTAVAWRRRRRRRGAVTASRSDGTATTRGVAGEGGVGTGDSDPRGDTAAGPAASPGGLGRLGFGEDRPAAAVSREAGPIAHEGLWLGLAAIVLLVVARPPVLEQVLDHLPYLDPSPNFHQRAGVLFVLAAAALAASGLGRLAALDTARRRLRAVAAPAAALGAAILWAYLAHPPPDGAIPWRLTARWLAIQLGALGGGAALVALIARPRRRALAAALVLAAELALLHGPANPSLPRRLYYPTPAPLAFLQAASAAEPGARTAALDAALPPLVPAIYGLADSRTRAREATIDYHRLVEPLLPPAPADALLFARADHPLLDLLGVRWLLAAPGAEADLPLVFDHPDGRVYERPGALPRLFLPASAEIHRPGRPWPPRVAAIAGFRRRALVAETPEHPVHWQARAPTSDIALTALDPARLTARATLAEERLLATSIHHEAGWRLLLDGAPHPTTLANGPLLAAWLPPGPHHLELLYRPRPFLTALSLAALSLATLLTWLGRPTSGPSRYS